MNISQVKKDKIKAALSRREKTKTAFSEELHPRYPAGHPQGGKFMIKGSADYKKAVSKAPVVEAKKAPVVEAKKAPVVEAKKAPVVEAKKAKPKGKADKMKEAIRAVASKESVAGKAKADVKPVKDSSDQQITAKIKSGKPIMSNEVPDPDRLGSARLLKYGDKAKTQDDVKKLISDATHRINDEFNYDGSVPLDKITKALGDRVSQTQIKDAIYDGFNSRISNRGEKKNGASMESIDVRSIPQLKPNDRTHTEASKINEKEFGSIAKTTLEDLNKKGNYKGLVPIYKLRESLGNTVSRGDFNNWLKNLNASDRVQLQGGGLEDDAPKKLEDSILTKTSGLRSHIKIK